MCFQGKRQLFFLSHVLFALLHLPICEDASKKANIAIYRKLQEILLSSNLLVPKQNASHCLHRLTAIRIQLRLEI